MRKKTTLHNMVLSALFVAVGLLLPMITGNVTSSGKMLCPMHLPIFVCGAVCGWQWGMTVGFITPLLRSLLFTMPNMYPDAVCMAFELAAYGLVIAVMLRFMSGRTDRLAGIYISLTIAMIVGRVVLGIAHFTLLGMFGVPYSWQIFISSAFVQAVPALLLQYAIIPPVVYAFGKYGSKRR